MKICAQSPIQSEYSVCGDAFDAPDTEDDVEPFRFVKPEEVVTCEQCREFIRNIRSSFPRGFRCISVEEY